MENDLVDMQVLVTMMLNEMRKDHCLYDHMSLCVFISHHNTACILIWV